MIEFVHLMGSSLVAATIVTWIGIFFFFFFLSYIAGDGYFKLNSHFRLLY